MKEVNEFNELANATNAFNDLLEELMESFTFRFYFKFWSMYDGALRWMDTKLNS